MAPKLKKWNFYASVKVFGNCEMIQLRQIKPARLVYGHCIIKLHLHSGVCSYLPMTKLTPNVPWAIKGKF